jgi:uncharacterized repeat protein (TIGR01451 family)
MRILRFAVAITWLFLVVALAIGSAPTLARADRALTARRTLTQHGDVTVVGNMIQHCRSGVAGCTAARADTSMTSGISNDGFVMDPIDVDSDATTFDSSTATLSIPASATVTWAGLYWSCSTRTGDGSTTFSAPAAAMRDRVVITGPGDSASTSVMAEQLDSTGTGGAIYQGFATMTPFVTARRGGLYTIGNIQCDRGFTGSAGGWSLVVVYRDDASPVRNMVVYDGFVPFGTGPGTTIPLSGFLTPVTGPIDASMTIATLDGDRQSSAAGDPAQDSLTLNGLTVSNTLNPGTDRGNGTITRFGVEVTTRTPAYRNTLGYDLDTFAVGGLLTNGATSATIALSSASDAQTVGLVTFSTVVQAPHIAVTVAAVDVDGGALHLGDEIEYTITVANTTTDDDAIRVVISDDVPAGTTYVAGSMQIVGVPRTDTVGDDTADRVAIPSPRGGVVFRVGTMATATAGGRLNTGTSVTASFRVRVASVLAVGLPFTDVATASFSGNLLGSSVTMTERGTATIATGDVCGDGFVTAPETCDGGNAAAGDGCNSDCHVEIAITSPSDGATTANPTPVISGTADASAAIDVGVDGVSIGGTTADGAGDWTFTPSAALLDGARVIRATATDSAAGVSSAMVSVTVMTIPPDSGPPDAGVPDAWVDDAAVDDAAVDDAGLDAAVDDAAVDDAAVDDAAVDDAGLAEVDAASPDGGGTFDAGSSAIDGGALVDGGTTGSDAGAATDAAASLDATVTIDAAIPRDGAAIDAAIRDAARETSVSDAEHAEDVGVGTPGVRMGGCSIGPGALRTSRPGLSFAFVLAGLGVTLSKRRRRPAR